MHSHAFRFWSLIREGEDSSGWRKYRFHRGIVALAALYVALVLCCACIDVCDSA